MSASPYATIVRTDSFNIAKANAFVRLHFDDSGNPVHEVQGHNDVGYPFHHIKIYSLVKGSGGWAKYPFSLVSEKGISDGAEMPS